jgi:hypothetical protein
LTGNFWSEEWTTELVVNSLLLALSCRQQRGR